MTSEPKAQGISEGLPPSHQLTGDKPLTNEEAALLVVHECMGLYLEFKHTRTRESFMKLIKRAQYLETLGYVFVLERKEDCIGAHRKAAGIWNVH
jgi:hypothetical protein